MAACPKRRAIGGFQPLEAVSPQSAGGVFAFWGVRHDNAWCFANARSALAHLLRTYGVKRLVLPAYVCPELAVAAGRDVAVAYYPLSDTLSPRVEALDAMLSPDDCAVVVDYFGRPPALDIQDLATGRSDVLWVEDRAQALSPGCAPWAEWVLYSPRKLFGVPDGGIMLRTRGSVPAVAYAADSAENRAIPRTMRRDDTNESDTVVWYDAYRDVESRMTVSHEPMSALTRQLLAGIDPGLANCRRRENYERLAEMLPEMRLFADPAEDFAPFGFPVRVADCEAVQGALARRRIFAARYWPALPSDPEEFSVEHSFARELLLLPCDQRYDSDDMEIVAQAFREVIG